MKMSIIAFASVTAALVCLAPGVSASTTHHRHAKQSDTHYGYKHHSHKTHHAKYRKYSAHPRKGYSRRGPLYGYGFGFSTYAGDPFAKDDYFDGRRCHYLRGQDFCRGPKSLDWLRW